MVVKFNVGVRPSQGLVAPRYLRQGGKISTGRRFRIPSGALANIINDFLHLTGRVFSALDFERVARPQPC